MSRAMRDQEAAIPHLSKGEIADLRGDVDGAFNVLEGKPTITKVTGGGSVSLAAVPVAKAITGAGFLQGQTKASLALGTGTAALTFTANRPGEPGNDITVEITQGVSTLVVSAVGNVATIELAAAGSTANAVKAAWDAAATTKILAQVVSGGTGTVLVAAETPLAGGDGEGLSVKANGLEQQVAGSVTDTSIPMLVSNLTGAANLDKVGLHLVSDGVAADAFSLDIVT